jgi:hypothetical protein
LPRSVRKCIVTASMDAKKDFLIRKLGLARLLKIHSHAVERYVWLGILIPEDYVRHGRTMQPVFRVSRLKEYQQMIADHLHKLKSSEKERKLAQFELLKKELETSNG